MTTKDTAVDIVAHVAARAADTSAADDDVINNKKIPK